MFSRLAVGASQTPAMAANKENDLPRGRGTASGPVGTREELYRVC
jgi:hypothetical protein